MANDSNGNLSYRQKRVKRIKRIIIVLCVILIILPIALSIFLLCRVRSLEYRIEMIVSENGLATGNSETTDVVIKAEAKKDAVSPASVEAEEPKKVYLTFDDGPSRQTEKVLDVLKKKNIHATFFAIGREDEFSEKMYKRIIKEGHTLGMHSYSHRNKEIYGSLEEFKRDFTKISDYLFEVTGIKPAYYRFPGGSMSVGTDIPLKEYTDFLSEQGVGYMDWNVLAANGASDDVTKGEMVESVMDGVSQYDTSIVLLYDSADKEMTAKSLEAIIDSLLDGGYEILPIDANTVPVHHS